MNEIDTRRTRRRLAHDDDQMLFTAAEAFRRGLTVEEVAGLSAVDPVLPG
jgi:hypothetical protein